MSVQTRTQHLLDAAFAYQEAALNLKKYKRSQGLEHQTTSLGDNHLADLTHAAYKAAERLQLMAVRL